VNGDDLTFTFDGATVHARRGWTIGAALLASGVTSWRTTRSRGRPRGLFCGIGACFDCLVDVNGDRAVRACLVPVRDGDQVRTSASVGAHEPGPRNTPEPRSAGEGAASPCESADVAVVGAGPAGMAAALAAADLGCQVTLIDSAAAMGGQIYRQRLMTGDEAAGVPSASGSGQIPRRLCRAARHKRIRYLPATTVWHAETHAASGKSQHGQFLLWLAGTTGRATPGPGQPGVLRARAVVVATGAAELVLPFPGWDLPGVTTAGAAQALLKGHGVTAGRRVLVAGSGPLLLPVAAGLADAGARVVAVLEAAPAGAAARRAAALALYPGKLREAAGYLAVLARHRVPVRTGHAVIACHGTDRVCSATVARLDGGWRPVPGTVRDVAVDAVHVGFGFSPALELTRLLGCADVPHPARPTAFAWHDADYATSVPGVFAAGETTGVGGAVAAELEGYLAGASAARHLGQVSGAAWEARTRRVRARLGPARRFAALLGELYPFMPGWLGWPAPGTIVCRCEDVPWHAISDAVTAGARDVRAVKGLTRCGMGYCQGRVCGPVVQYALASATGQRLADAGDLHSRPLLAPTTLGAIAASQGDRIASPWPE
jgi:thioredoxin reductase